MPVSGSKKYSTEIFLFRAKYLSNWQRLRIFNWFVALQPHPYPLPPVQDDISLHGLVTQKLLSGMQERIVCTVWSVMTGSLAIHRVLSDDLSDCGYTQADHDWFIHCFTAQSTY